MTDPVAPAEGLIRREINGVEYWWNEETKKVHSPVSVGRKIVHAFQIEAAKVEAELIAVPTPVAPVVPVVPVTEAPTPEPVTAA